MVRDAVRARRIIELHENYNAVERTYTPGVGFRVLVEGLILDEQVKIEAAAYGLLER